MDTSRQHQNGCASNEKLAKRKLSLSAGDAERVIKRRAARACQSCRTRKVRCDILVNGERCTNCKLDNLECILLVSRRGRPDRGQKESHASPLASPSKPDGDLGDMKSDRDTRNSPLAAYGEQERNQNFDFCRSKSAASTTDEVPICLTFDDEDVRDMPECRQRRNDELEQPQIQTITEAPINYEAGNELALDRYHPESNNLVGDWAQSKDSSIRQTSSTHPGMDSASTGSYASELPSEIQLPPFIKPLPSDMDSETIDFLAKKGAFIVPEPELRSELIHSYINSVHTFMPILNLSDFLEAVFDDGTDRKISILLFQAVMFAGLSSLKPGVVSKTGSETIKQARTKFFAKVRLLYDFDIEPENIEILQSLLLMSMWYEKWNDRKHTWYWTGQALSHAQSMGLHREASAPGVSPEAQRLRRRIWWSLYIRDRLIALGTRRPIRIKDEDFDVKMLEVSDFDIPPSNSSSAVAFDAIHIEQDIGKSTLLATMCVELCKLCICMGYMLTSQYTTLGERAPLNSTLMVIPRSPHERAKNLAECDQKLEDWYRRLDPQVRILATEVTRGLTTDVVGIQWSILHMIYLTSLSVLHRPQVLQPDNTSPDALKSQQHSREKVKDTARELSKVLHTMLRRDQVHFLPTSGIPAALSAALGHMLDIKSKDEDIRDASIFRFYQTMQVLQRLREVYAAADSAVSFLASAVRKTGITVPIQLAAQATPAFMIASTSNEKSRSIVRSRDHSHKDSPKNADLSSPANLHGYPHGSLPLVHTHQANAWNQFPEIQSFSPQESQPQVLPGATFPQPSNRLSVNSAPALISDSLVHQHISSKVPCAPESNGWNKQLESELPREAGPATLPDPLSYWVVDEDYFAVNNFLDFTTYQEPHEFDFSSDAFGLLDGLIKQPEETQVMANISRTGN